MFVVGKCHRYKIFVLVSRVPSSVQLCAAIRSLARNELLWDVVGWLAADCRNTLPAGREIKRFSAWARLLMTKAVRFFETSGATQQLRQRHFPEAAVLSYTPLRTSTVRYFYVLISLLLNQPSSWKTTPCRLSRSVYATYSQLPFIPAGRLLGTRHAAVTVKQYEVVVVDFAACFVVACRHN